VPIPKVEDCRTKAMSCDDFRGIAISPVLSKVFEHRLLKQLQSFIESNDNHFGFKKGVGCSHAIYTARNIVDRWVSMGYRLLQIFAQLISPKPLIKSIILLFISSL